MALMRRERLGWDWPELWRRFWEPDVGGWLRVEEYRDGNELVVRAEIPGIDPEKDVEITVSDGLLHISARREERSETRDKAGYRSEFRYGSFERTVALPAGAKESDVKASYRDGILEVRVPVEAEAEKAATVRIPVTRG
jgi:HSP20 family protein